jgi:hypothetical protein
VGEIIVKKDFSAAEEKKAASQPRSSEVQVHFGGFERAERGGPRQYGSPLLFDHVKQFATPSVLRMYGYRQVDDYPYVMGNCDYCQLHERCTMFIHESLFAQVWRTKEQRRRDHEYAAIVRG